VCHRRDELVAVPAGGEAVGKSIADFIKMGIEGAERRLLTTVEWAAKVWVIKLEVHASRPGGGMRERHAGVELRSEYSEPAARQRELSASPTGYSPSGRRVRTRAVRVCRRAQRDSICAR
jgi:hypothetical protein